MKAKEVLELLKIIELSSKSPTYAHITGAAHEALVNAQLVALAKAEKEEDDEPNPPRVHAPTVRRT